MLFVLLVSTSRANAEVYVSAEQLAARIAAETQRLEGTNASQANGNWHDAVRPLVIVHAGHGTRGYERTHIPGAIFLEGRESYDRRDGLKYLLPEPQAFADWLGQHGIGPGRDLLLYGDAAGVFPARVYAGLAMVGLADHARMLDGHLRHWVLDGRPTSDTPEPLLPPVAFEASTAQPAIADHVPLPGDPEASAVPTVVLDARVADAFTGEKPVPDTDQRGHLPGSANLPWRQLIPDIKDPLLVPDAPQRVNDAILQALRQHATSGSNPAHAELLRRAHQTPDPVAYLKAHLPVQILDDRGNGSAILFTIARHFGWSQAAWNPRGLNGYLQDGGQLTGPSE